MSYRVGIDGYNLALARGTGVAEYGRGLAAAVRGLERPLDLVYGLDVPPGAAPALRETLFFERLGEGRSGGEAPAGKPTLRRLLRRAFLSSRVRDLVPVPLTGRVIGDTLADRLPACDRLFTHANLFHLGARHFRRFGRFLSVRMPSPPAVMHWTYPVPVRLEGALNLYTIHDLVPLRLPFLSLEDKTYHETLLRHCLAEADHIVTVSEASRQDIVERLDADPECVTNTYQAAEESWSLGEQDEDELAALFDLPPQGYFLFVGAIEPKKNVGRLIEAYLRSGVDTPLILAGPRAWQADAELRLIEGEEGRRLPGAARIRRIDYLPRAQLRTLMRGARALLFPSLYEGFGLPVLEAMALGVPVLAGDAASLPEIVGDAGLLADPYDVSAIAAAIRRLDGDGALRARLAAAGRDRASRHFSMSAYQARLTAIHARLLRPRLDCHRFEEIFGSCPLHLVPGTFA